MKKRLFACLLILQFSAILHAEITVAVFEGARPVCFTDENGRATGLYPELLRYIFGDEEVLFITGLSFREAYDQVLAGEIDIMPVFVKNEEREKYFDFNREVVTVSWSQLFVAPNDRIESIMDLKNERIALLNQGQNGINFINFMKGFDIPFEAVYFDDVGPMVEAVLAGEVRGMVSFGSFLLSDDRLSATAILFKPTQALLAVRKGENDYILEAFDRALSSMKQDENSVYHREVDRWLVREGEEVVPLWIYALIALFMGAILVVFLFNLLLRLRVNQIRSRLQKSEAEYRNLFHAAREMIVVFSYTRGVDGRILAVNDSFCSLTGYKREEIIDQSVLDFFGGEYKEILLQIRDEIERKGFALTEIQMPTRGGGDIHVETSIRVFEADGEFQLLSISRDLRDRDELSSALNSVQQKYSSVANYNFDWEFWQDETGRFIYISPACERISGYRAEDFQNDPKLMDSIVYEDDKNLWRRHRHGMLSEEEGREYLDFRVVSRDGSIHWLQHQCMRIHSPGGEDLGVRGSFRDITEQKEMEEQLNRKQRLESLGILAGGIAHDFNNILSIIKGYSDLGMMHKEGDENLKSMFETINQASKRGEDLTGKILDFSRNRRSEQKAVKVSDIVREVHSLIKASFPSTIEIRTELVSDACILADEGQVHRIIMNICTNARLAMPDGGTLTLSVREKKIREVPGGLPEYDGENCLELRIRDTGVGMSDEVKRRVFDPFFTTRKGGEGSGMGLSVVHGIVSGWNGQVSIESAPGEGTALVLDLPILDGGEDEDETAVEEFSPRNQKAHKVLVVDDEPLILNLLETYLSRAGFVCSTFSSSEEALEEFKKAPDDFDLVLADMTMPGMRGDQLTEAITAIRGNIPVILCSGYSEYADQDNLPAGAQALLGKPFGREDLLKTVNRILSA